MINEIQTNTTYALKSGKDWGLVISFDAKAGTVKVEMVDGRIEEFSIIEFNAWTTHKFLRPRCGICNQPIPNISFPYHLKTHLVNVHG